MLIIVLQALLFIIALTRRHTIIIEWLLIPGSLRLSNFELRHWKILYHQM